MICNKWLVPDLFFHKIDVEGDANRGGGGANGANGTFYYKGPQGDILRLNNKIRCVRDIE